MDELMRALGRIEADVANIKTDLKETKALVSGGLGGISRRLVPLENRFQTQSFWGSLMIRIITGSAAMGVISRVAMAVFFKH